jgi:Sugar (and other) transporter
LTSLREVVGRLLVGIASGAVSLVVPRHIAEISPTAIRGALGTLNQVGAGRQLRQNPGPNPFCCPPPPPKKTPMLLSLDNACVR